MLRFSIFQSALDSPAGQWALRHATLVGPDELAIPADVEYEDNLVTCIPKVDGSCALSLQYPVEGFGLITLQTCLLKERKDPYLLSLELARHRVMQVLNKLEEWALFDQGADVPAMKAVETAREAFTSALHSVRGAGGAFTIESDRICRKALQLALDAGEQLAMLHAQTQHTKRLSGELARIANKPPPANALTDHEARKANSAAFGTSGVILPEMPRVGCAVSSFACTQGMQDALVQACDFVSIPMRWIEMEPSEGKYAFAKTDKWIEWAVLKAKLPVVAGPVVDLSPRAVPDWLYIWEHDYETLRDVVATYVKTLVTRYRRTVHTWTIASGLHTGMNFSLTYEQSLDLTRTCVLLTKKLHPQARVQVEVVQPWGEYTARPKGQNAIPPHVYGEMLKQLNVPVDAIAVRMQMGATTLGTSARDLMEISSVIDHLAGLDLPINISCLGVPAAPPASDELGEEAQRDPGYYREPWSDQTQGKWLRAAGSILAGKSCVASICWHDLYDSPTGEMVGSGVMSASGAARPGLGELVSLRQHLREKRAMLPASEKLW